MSQKHTLSHYKLLTGDMGKLYPIGLTEVLPTDVIRHSANVFMRLSPMAAPVMHPVTVRVHHFFVPHRLTWPKDKSGSPETGWEAFITGGPDGNDSQTVPTSTYTVTKGDVLDYLGLPVKTVTVSSLPLAAFNLVYNEWFRDSDLVPERALTDQTVPRISWEKDYFSTARPWPQKGPAVTLPLGTSAPVVPHPSDPRPTWSPSPNLASSKLFIDAGSAQNAQWGGGSGGTIDPLGAQWVNPALQVDLSQSTQVDIVRWREAFALQRWAEARARFGSRYPEYLRFLGARPQDQRLQRPELLSSGRARVSISEVLQTSNEATPSRFGVGDLYGHGVAGMRSNAYRRRFEEHGYVVSLLSVRPKAIYMNGSHRTWLRRTREEFWQRELQHIGQQEVWDGELFTDNANDYNTFGYSDRYAEYRSVPSQVAGDFRDSLKYWHLARDFASQPALNQTFTDCDASKRIFNVQSEDTLWIAVNHSMVARRPVTRDASGRVL